MHIYIRLKDRFPVSDLPRRDRHVRLLDGGGRADHLGRRRADRAARHAARAPRWRERLAGTDAAVIMKLGRNFAKVRAAIAQAGLLDRAIYVERGTMANEKVLPLAEKTDDEAPYFSMIIVPGQGRRP